MAIVKMKSVTIAGPVEQFNTILEKYICDKQLHLEDAMSVLSNREKLYPFEDANNYDPVIKRVEDISHQSGMVLSEEEVSVDYSLDRMNEILSKAEDVISEDNKCLSGYETELERYHDIVNSLDNVIDINVDFSKILAFSNGSKNVSFNKVRSFLNLIHTNSYLFSRKLLKN